MPEIRNTSVKIVNVIWTILRERERVVEGRNGIFPEVKWYLLYYQYDPLKELLSGKCAFGGIGIWTMD